MTQEPNDDFGDILDLLDDDFAGDFADLPDDEEGDLPGLESSDGAGGEMDGPGGLLPSEGVIESALDRSLQSFRRGLESITRPPPRRRRRVRQAKLRVVSEEDYTDNPAIYSAVRLMRLRAESILTGKPYANQSPGRWIAWFFGMLDQDENGLSFDITASACGGDPDAIRLRFHQRLYELGIRLQQPISEFVRPPEEDLLTMSQRIAGYAGRDIVQAIWRWPSIPRDELITGLLDKHEESRIIHAIDELDDAYLIHITDERCYFLGPNGRRYRAQIERQELSMPLC